MITLGGLTLPSSLFWVNRDEWVPVGAVIKTALDGTVHLYSSAAAGRQIDLVCEDNNFVITYALLQELRALASISAVYGFSYYGEALQVAFRHEDPPVLDLSPIKKRMIYDDDDKFYGIIKLREV